MHEEKQDSKTFATLVRRLGVPGPPSRLVERYAAGEDVFGTILNSEQSSQAELELWLQCIRAPSLGQALAVMAAHPDIRWPEFVLLHTFARNCRSRLEAYNAVRQLQKSVAGAEVHFRAELASLVVGLTQKHLVDMVPVAVRVFLDASPEPLSPAVVNELLWQIAGFGRNWSQTDVPLLIEAQELIVKRAGTAAVDSKGLFALAYITHFKHPDAAKRAMADLQPIVARRSPESQEFAYTCGPTAMSILAADTGEDALIAIGSVASTAETRGARATALQATGHLPMLWTCLCLSLARRRLLKRDVALRILRKLGAAKVRLTALLAELLLGAITDLRTKTTVLNSVTAQGLRLTPALGAKMVKVSQPLDLEVVLGSAYMKPLLQHPRVLHQVLDTQSRIAPAQAWDTYTRLRAGSEPTRAALQFLCRAAWDPTLIWDGMYAAQRALAEVKATVRGALAPAQDLMRIYPDERLLYNYLIMIGRAGYTDELVTFLGWMEALEFTPTKRMLLALIHFSPQGPALLKLGQKTRPPRSEWPTEEEYDLFAQQL